MERRGSRFPRPSPTGRRRRPGERQLSFAGGARHHPPAIADRGPEAFRDPRTRRTFVPLEVLDANDDRRARLAGPFDRRCQLPVAREALLENEVEYRGRARGCQTVDQIGMIAATCQAPQRSVLCRVVFSHDEGDVVEARGRKRIHGANEQFPSGRPVGGRTAR